MGAEGVRFNHAAPVRAQPYYALRPDPVAPVILVGKTAARPAYVRYMQRFQGGNHIVANAPRVWDRRVTADPDSFVNAMSEMLGELPEKIAVNLRTRFGWID